MDQHTLEVRDKILQSMMSNKQGLVKRYGSEAEKVMFGRATNSAKRQVAAETERQDKLRETIRQCLSGPTQKLLEKQRIDKQGVEWNDEDYDKDMTDYVATPKEVDIFKRDEKGLPPRQEYKKKEYTDQAYLEVNNGLNKWQVIDKGPKQLMYAKLKQKQIANRSFADRYRVTPEQK